ncbi:MAG: translation initiation factor IF-6 [Candidatus Njordarchaeia archaeon]
MEERKNITIVEYQGSYNIGAFGIATDKYAIFGRGFREKTIKEIEEVLNVPVIEQNVMGEPITGILLSGNSNGLLAPKGIKEDELKALKEMLPDVNIGLINFKTFENALGNLVLANDKGALIQTYLYRESRKTVEIIEDTLGVEVEHYEFFTPVIRTIAVANNKGALVHPLMSDEEIEKIKDVLKLKTIGKGTGNTGSPFVGTCYIVNSYGIVAGLKTSGPELQRAYEILL